MIDNAPATGGQARVVGTMRAQDGTGIVRMEDRFDTAIDDLWSAVSDPQRLARWIAEVKGDLQLGGNFRASFTSGWEGPGRVDVCEPPRRLHVTMSPGQPDETVIVAELDSDGTQTTLLVEERGLPLDGVAAYGAGWQAHIEDLGAYLRGDDTADWRTRWAELKPAYDEQAADLA